MEIKSHDNSQGWGKPYYFGLKFARMREVASTALLARLYAGKRRKVDDAQHPFMPVLPKSKANSALYRD
jgi:hypothetical protein